MFIWFISVLTNVWIHWSVCMCVCAALRRLVSWYTLSVACASHWTRTRVCLAGWLPLSHTFRPFHSSPSSKVSLFPLPHFSLHTLPPAHTHLYIHTFTYTYTHTLSHNTLPVCTWTNTEYVWNIRVYTSFMSHISIVTNLTLAVTA